MNIISAKKQIIKAAKELSDKGLISRTRGNISSRVDESSFVITPSGKDLLSIRKEDIVKVDLNTLKHEGEMKPSLEKGIHAEVLRAFPDINFVIHTHQENASIISACDLPVFKISRRYSNLGGEIICSEYALPDSDDICRKLALSLRESSGMAVLLKNHGAVCFGADKNSAIETAIQLEEACKEVIKSEYLRQSGMDAYEDSMMYGYAVSKKTGKYVSIPYGSVKRIFESVRNRTGFTVTDGLLRRKVAFDNVSKEHGEEAKLYNMIFKSLIGVNHIIINYSKAVIAMEYLGKPVKPMVDDFARIVGTKVMRAGENPRDVVRDLKKSSAVFLRNIGLLCCGRTEDEAKSVSEIAEKNCKAYLAAFLFGEAKPIKRMDSVLLRKKYLNRYLKQVEENRVNDNMIVKCCNSLKVED